MDLNLEAATLGRPCQKYYGNQLQTSYRNWEYPTRYDNFNLRQDSEYETLRKAELGA